MEKKNIGKYKNKKMRIKFVRCLVNFEKSI